ncbi:MAG TPA: 30S ribosomal protein S17 [Candidatus Binatia bacterium]|nr:30S ribosomal protein S17 [Candidatus Binatia bacterium]
MSETTKTEAAERTVVGRVVSNKMQKTIVISVDREYIHPKYGKRLRRSTKLHAHDEKNECAVGDLVSVRECRPLSANKHWMLVQVLEKAPAAVADANI